MLDANDWFWVFTYFGGMVAIYGVGSFWLTIRNGLAPDWDFGLDEGIMYIMILWPLVIPVGAFVGCLWIIRKVTTKFALWLKFRDIQKPITKK